MAVRLHYKLGLVPERDRLDSSADTTVVVEPSVGSIARSKGNLYAVVTAAPGSGGRARQATALVSDTIRREYYYDESAGIPVCLAKALRSANRKLRGGREGHDLREGVIGASVAVVRGHELYVATIGDADAYLVRAARLLTLPEHGRGPGLPVGTDARVDVWRGELAVGDTLLLCGRNVTRAVGTEELKNAVVTLHPQSAVEHLHHIFATAGDGSDALLAVEATELATERASQALVAAPARRGEGSEDEAAALAGQAANALAATAAAARRVREAVGDAVYGAIDALSGRLPRRGPRYRSVTPLAARRESQRRGAFALLMLIALTGVLGVGIWTLGAVLAGGRDRQVVQVSAGETAFALAKERIAQAAVPSIPDEQELRILREAWAQLQTAERAGVAAAKIRPLRQQTSDALDRLYRVQPTTARVVLDFAELIRRPDLTDLVIGPDGAAYVLDRSTASAYRVDVAKRTATKVIEPGDGPGDGVRKPLRLTRGGPDLVILDTDGVLWRWRPSEADGDGTLGRLRAGGDPAWGTDVQDAATFLRNADAGLYSLYVVAPRERQILSFQPIADGSGFSAPTGYLTSAADVSGVRQLVVDGDVYALTSDRISRYQAGRLDDLRIAVPPDDADLRPGHDYRLFAGAGRRRHGRLYVWDARHSRIVVFSKADGAFLGQFDSGPGVAPFEDLRGMAVVERSGGRPPVLLWLTAGKLFSSVLDASAGGAAAPTPAGARSPSASPSASGSP